MFWRQTKLDLQGGAPARPHLQSVRQPHPKGLQSVPLNGFAILDGFLCVMRLVLAAGLLGLGWTLWHRTPDHNPEPRENASYLLYLGTLTAAGLNLISWPVFYLLLERQIADYPGVMCIYGVLQIGRGSSGAGRWLPALAATLQWLRPLLVFTGGAACLLYGLNRRTPNDTLRRPVLGLVLLTAHVMACDASVELAYLGVPRGNLTPPGGCCTNPLEIARQQAAFSPTVSIGEDGQPALWLMCGLVNLVLIAGLLASVMFPPTRPRADVLIGLCLMELVALPVNWLFLKDVAAPEILGLPFHHCPYDLLGYAPESLAGIALAWLGSFCTGWAMIAFLTARICPPEIRLRETLSQLLFVGLFAHLGAAVVVMLEIWLS